MSDGKGLLADVEGTCLVYVSDDGLYMRQEEACKAGSTWAQWMVEPLTARFYHGYRLPIPGPVPTGPAGDRVVSKLLGREVRHWKREER